jgi:hypothetical protein
MDCQVFEVLIDDLGRDLPIDVTIRQQGLDHARCCLQCSNRLDEARALSGALRALAAADATEQAPLYLEGVLLNAFEEVMKVDSQAQGARLFSRARLAWLGVAAAVALTAVGLALVLTRERALHQGPGLSQAPAAQQAPVMVGSAGAQPEVGDASEKPSAAQPPSRRMPAYPRPKSNRPAGHVVWATDFLPLPYADNSAPLGDADIVRLTLPNSALASLGLPVTEESTAKEITADVLLGEDGIPRAISFVRL